MEAPFSRRRLHIPAARRCLIVLLIGAAFLRAADASAGGEKRFLADVPFRDGGDLAALSSGGFDLAGVNRAEMTVRIVAREGDLERLGRMGFAVRLVGEREAGAKMPPDLQAYTDPAELAAFLGDVAARRPGIAREYLLAGDLFEGQKVYAMKITADPDARHDRPVFILDAQHHAREVMTTEIAVDMIDYLTSRYETDPRVRHWVDNIVIWVIPSVNPDGAAYMFRNDQWWRKNRNPQCSDDPDLIGVDLNRNYGWGWNRCPGGSSSSCEAVDYRGPRPESEPETRSMVELMSQARAVFALTYHSFGEEILYPLGCSDGAEGGAFESLARSLNDILENDDGMTGSYYVGPAWTLYPTDGTSDDTAYGRFGTFTFTIEVNRDFQPDYRAWRDITVWRQRAAWQFFLDRTLDTPSIRGRVTDAATGKGLPAFIGLEEVRLISREKPRRADDDGRYFRITEADRTYHVNFSMPGYMNRTVEMTVGKGNAWLDVQLSPSPYRIDGIRVLRSPLRLQVNGEGFTPGSIVMINGTPAPWTKYGGKTRLMAGKGAALGALLPRGRLVYVVVEEPGKSSSAPFPFRR